MSYQAEIVHQDGKEQYILYQNTEILSFREVIDKWISDKEFCSFYTKTLKKSSFKAYFWEHPALNVHLLDTAYQFELIESKTLENVSADVYAFQSYFSTEEDVVIFQNLGKDALLVVPCPVKEIENYAHLAHFVRKAPNQQIYSFWNKVGEMYQKQVKSRLCWLSTSGLGVYWLHARLDQYPKYYIEKNYRNPDYLKTA